MSDRDNDFFKRIAERVRLEKEAAVPPRSLLHDEINRVMAETGKRYEVVAPAVAAALIAEGRDNSALGRALAKRANPGKVLPFPARGVKKNAA